MPGDAEPVVPQMISTHSLLAEGDEEQRLELVGRQGISTHSLLAEGDVNGELALALITISTHSLLAEGDVPGVTCKPIEGFDFNPLPPRGGRPSGS